MIRLEREKVFEIWNRHGDSPATIARHEKVNVSDKSVWRYQKSLELLMDGQSDEAVAKAVGWKTKRAAQVRGWFHEWQSRKEKAAEDTKETQAQPGVGTSQYPLLMERTREHWEQLARVAEEASKEILLPFQMRFAPTGGEWVNPRTGKRELVGDLVEFEQSTVKWHRAREGLISLEAEWRNSLLWESLLAHMDAESGFRQTFEDWRRNCTSFVDHTEPGISRSDLYEEGQKIAEQLRLVGLRRTFQNTCDICRSWWSIGRVTG